MILHVEIDFNVKKKKKKKRGWIEKEERRFMANEARVTGEPTDAEEYFLAQEQPWLGEKVAPGSAVTGNEILEQFYGTS